MPIKKQEERNAPPTTQKVVCNVRFLHKKENKLLPEPYTVEGKGRWEAETDLPTNQTNIQPTSYYLSFLTLFLTVTIKYHLQATYMFLVSLTYEELTMATHGLRPVTRSCRWVSGAM